MVRVKAEQDGRGAQGGGQGLDTAVAALGRGGHI